jgi:hypothetical protein
MSQEIPDGKPADEEKIARSPSGTEANPVQCFPRHSVEQALRIPDAILQQNSGNPATPNEAVGFAGGAKLSGSGRVESALQKSKAS